MPNQLGLELPCEYRQLSGSAAGTSWSLDDYEQLIIDELQATAGVCPSSNNGTETLRAWPLMDLGVTSMTAASLVGRLNARLAPALTLQLPSRRPPPAA